MKKLILLITFSPLLLWQCTGKEAITLGCGCEGGSVIKVLTNANATVLKSTSLSTDDNYYLMLDSLNYSNQNFASLTPCDAGVLSGGDFKNGMKVRVSGLIKSYCAAPNIKVWASPVKITKIEAEPIVR